MSKIHQGLLFACALFALYLLGANSNNISKLDTRIEALEATK